MPQLFAEFIQHRVYLKGVSTQTVIWYNSSFKAFDGALDSKQNVVTRIAELKQRGLSHVSINSHLRCINAYLNWLHTEHGEPLLKIPRLKEQQKVLATFSAEQIGRIVKGKPSGRNETRVRMIALTAIDTGMRIQELLNLRRPDVDFVNSILKVNGKGNIQRLVPMSLELRKVMFRHLSQHPFERVFATSGGTEPTKRNLHRDFKLLCGRLGIKDVRCSFHVSDHLKT